MDDRKGDAGDFVEQDAIEKEIERLKAELSEETREHVEQHLAHADAELKRKIAEVESGKFRYRDHVQKEAFMLMTYATNDRRLVERIWNSRDGVTPFVVTSPTGREMTHVDWRDDRYAPFHVPAVGDRIFVNLTIERAVEARTRYVERWWDEMKIHDHYESREKAIADLAKADMLSFAPHTPDLVVVDDELLKTLEVERQSRVGQYRPRKFA